MELNKRLFVGGLSHSATKNSLREHFSKYGDVKSSEIIKDRYTGRNRGFGFVTFSDSSSTNKALADDQHVIMEKEVDVKIATPKVPKNREPDSVNIINPKRIFVGGLPRDVTPNQFRAYFASFGTIVGVEIPLNRGDANKFRGFGYVMFDSAETVDNVLSVALHKIGDNTVEVLRATYPQKVEAPRECLAHDSCNIGLCSHRGEFANYPCWCSCHGDGNGGMVAPFPYYVWCYGTGYYYPHMSSFEYQDNFSYNNCAYVDSSFNSKILDNNGCGDSQGSMSVRCLSIGEVRSCKGFSNSGAGDKDKVSNSFNDTDKGKSVNINGYEGTSTNQEILDVQSSQYMKPDLRVDQVELTGNGVGEQIGSCKLVHDGDELRVGKAGVEDLASPIETILISEQIQGNADL